jgi:hypothetical protein
LLGFEECGLRNNVVDWLFSSLAFTEFANASDKFIVGGIYFGY